MTDRPVLSGLRFVRAPEYLVRKGLVAWASFELPGGIRADGVTIRRRLEDGTLGISFPGHWDRAGIRHAYLKPVDEAARRALEKQILAAFAKTEGS